MSKINPNLLTANGSNFMITVLNKGQGEPAKLTIVTLSAAAKGATSLSVVISVPTGYTAADISIVNGTYFVADNQIISVDGTIQANATTITVDPLTADLPQSSSFTTYIGSVPLIGLESANLQLQKEVNQVVLLSSKGWSNKDYSTGSWQYSGNLMIPVSTIQAEYGQKIYFALLNEKSLWVERILQNGRYFAGRAIATDASDTVSGNAYVSVSMTLQGSGRIYQKIIDTPVQTTPTPAPTIPTVLNPGYRVIILAGQSNAEGSGYPKDPTLDAGDPRMYMYAPGNGQYSNQLLLASEHLPNSEGEIPYPDNITFATHFVKNYLVDHPADKVVILTCARGNTGFSTNNWRVGDDLYLRAVNVAQNFIANHADSNMLAILWHQGERDHDNGVAANDQKNYLLAMIDGFRSSLGATLPFICGGLSPDWIIGDGLKAQYNAMFAALNQSRSYTAFADSTGLAGGGNGNDIHFNAPSLRIFGARYYEAYKVAKDYILGGAIPAATNVTGTSVNNSIVKLSWSQTGVYVNFSIQYKLNSSGTWLTTTPIAFNYGMVTGLTPNTLYNFRIRTNGAGGSVAYSSVINVTTGNADVTLPNSVIWLKFATSNSNQNDQAWGWGSSINVDDSQSLKTDSQRGQVLRIYDNQGYAFYHQIPDEFTQAAWIKLDTSRAFAAIFGSENGLSSGRRDLMINNGEGLQAWGDNYSYLDATDDTIPNDIWMHVAWSVSKLTQTNKLYINGVLRKTILNIAHNPDGSNNCQFIGLLTFGGGSWDNWLDDVMMYDSVLNDAQLAKVYQLTYL